MQDPRRPGAAADASPPGGRPWFEEAFREAYLSVYPHRDLAAAREEVAGLLGRGGEWARGGRVLDLGCGFGRHTLALREAGLSAFGLDLSAELLRHARELAGAEALAGRLVRGDFRALPFRDGAFDAVLLLFSSFGYLDDGANRRVLGQVARVLRPGGAAVLDLMNPARVRATLVPESRSERGGCVLLERRYLAHGDARVVKEVLLRDADGRERRWHEDVRLYEPGELRALAEAVGLTVERTEGGFDGRPYAAGDAEAPRQIAWLRRPSELRGSPAPPIAGT